VPLTDRDRKLLWGRSAGCCAMCKSPLTWDETDVDPAAVLGVEAHIVSGRPGGPRFRPLASAEVDRYDNLLLLCPNDHTRVDRQLTHFSEERLREIKAEHEKWAKERQQQSPRLRLRDAKPGVPTKVVPIATAADLLRIVDDIHTLNYSKPDDLADNELELIGSFLQEMTDWMDVLGMGSEPRARFDAERDLRRGLEEVQSGGFVLFGGTRQQILEGGIGPPESWRTGVLVVERARDASLDE